MKSIHLYCSCLFGTGLDHEEYIKYSLILLFFFIVMEFNDMSTLVGHFVLSPRKGRREIKEIAEEMKERDRGRRK